MSNSQILKQAILDYASGNSAEYALMVTGEWGSGKTHFWKNVISPTLKNDLGRGSLYVSLYGVTSASEVDKLVLYAQHPFLKNGMFEAFSKLSESALSALKVKVPTEGLKANLSDQVLCFDDLERAAPQAIPQLLGRINSFVEHDELKVIVLCEEDKVQSGCPDYATIKEKLIGYTYKYFAAPEEVIDQLVIQYAAEIGYSGYLADKKAVILATLESSGQKNLRTLKRALKCFHVVYKAINQKLGASEPLLERLLVLTISLVCELKKDDSKKTALANLFQGDESGWMLFIDSEDINKKFVKKYVETYFVSQFGYLGGFGSIFDFVTSGVLDSQKLTGELSSVLEKMQRTKTNEELFYSEFWKLSDDNLQQTADEILGKLKIGQVSTAAILVVLQRLFFFSSVGLLKQSSSQLKVVVNQLIDNLIQAGQLEPSDSPSLLMLPFNDPNDQSYRDVKERLLKLDKDANESKFRGEIVGAFDKLATSVDELMTLLYGKYSTTPLLNQYEPKKFVDLIAKLDADDVLKLNNHFINRYERITNVRDFLHPDLGALEAISQELKVHLEKSPTSLGLVRRYSIDLFSKTIERCCAILRP